jgi:hypothetical protein
MLPPSGMIKGAKREGYEKIISSSFVAGNLIDTILKKPLDKENIIKT